MENQQNDIAVGTGMNVINNQNLFERYQKDTDMTEAIQQGTNVDTSEGLYPSVISPLTSQC